MTRYYIVEDESIVSLSLEKTINLNPNRIVIGSSVTEKNAYEEIIRLKPDIIISDVNLGKGNGLQLIKKIKQQKEFENIKVLFITGYRRDIKLNEEINVLKNTLLIIKPVFDLDKILERLEAM